MPPARTSVRLDRPSWRGTGAAGISLGSDGIHFVEVKARVAPSTTDPSENVGYAKQRNMAKAAARYLATKGSGLGDQEIWFDVVSVLFEGGKASVDYLKGAFLPLGL